MFSNSNSLRPSFCLRLLFVLALWLLFVALGFVSQRTFAYDAQNAPTAVASYGSGETAVDYDALFTLAQAEGGSETIESRAFFAKQSEFQAAKGGANSIDDLVRAAQKEFPGKAGKIEQHHITPKYLGGDPKGPLAPLDAAYHQKITTEFRNLWPYGQQPPSSAELQRIMLEVYQKYPLPPGR